MGDQYKRPGKTEAMGRRRTATKKAGFKSAEGVSGGEYIERRLALFEFAGDTPVRISFEVPQIVGHLSGFGLWLYLAGEYDVSVSGPPIMRPLVFTPDAPNWGKVGSIWTSESNETLTFIVEIKCESGGSFAVYGESCGVLSHKYFDSALLNQPALLKNMYQFAPEALFIGANKGSVSMTGAKKKSEGSPLIHLKACNRCARYLPINTFNERAGLSFSNHCTAEHRRPCKHSGFGKLTNFDDDDAILQLDYGFQLECRFCKKFEVNAALNPKRTAGQMKEDGARRRYFELFLSELSGGSPQLLFRLENDGLELADYIWEKFSRRCFNCGLHISSAKEMNLDHTRPLAFLWPLDKTATCLCVDCNSSKRALPPVDFYSRSQLEQLSRLTGLSMQELTNPGPNLAAIRILEEKKEWFFTEFLVRPELARIREGKRTADLFVKALQKVLASDSGISWNLAAEYRARKTNLFSEEKEIDG